MAKLETAAAFTENGIADIIADGYDIGCATDEIAGAVFRYVTSGVANPFEEEASALHDADEPA